MPPAFIEVRGADVAEEMIRELGERSQQPRPFLTAAGNIVQAGFRRQMESDGAYYGPGWPALAAETLERKARQGFPTAIMRQTGRLEGTIGDFERISRFSAREGIGRADHVARFQQTGTKHMPRRVLLGSAEADRKRIYDLAREWLAGRFG